jgi:hypothetical protein
MKIMRIGWVKVYADCGINDFKDLKKEGLMIKCWP